VMRDIPEIFVHPNKGNTNIELELNFEIWIEEL
jgi:hypothetical protein